MLDDAEKKGHSHIISWNTDGKSFVIKQCHNNDSGSVLLPILKMYFRQTKYRSFLRQLQGYSFFRETRGEYKGKCSHSLFVRGRRSLCLEMKR
ncbi:hypothetical protein FRACYDRAFT_182865, partial [Fragilariopsis cylindrus CCMP1102]